MRITESRIWNGIFVWKTCQSGSDWPVRRARTDKRLAKPIKRQSWPMWSRHLPPADNSKQRALISEHTLPQLLPFPRFDIPHQLSRRRSLTFQNEVRQTPQNVSGQRIPVSVLWLRCRQEGGIADGYALIHVADQERHDQWTEMDGRRWSGVCVTAWSWTL